jgi:hypothetical protein
VRVKPLEWHDNRHAQSILGVYSINSWSSGAFSILRPNKGYPDNNSFPTVDEAKAAAQADYESRIFSALSNPSAAAESNASVEARLREDKLAAERQYLEEIADGAWGDNPLTQSAAKERLAALSAVGDEAKKSEGGVDWDDVRGIAPNATGDLSSEAFIREQRDSWDDHPSSPTAERREIVARIIDPEVFAKYDAELAKNRRAENGKRWADVCYGEAICRALAKADAILAALDGGASA